MLSLSSILNQLNTMQQLIVERNLQQQVSYNSRSLLVFNCLMLGQKKNEIIAESMLNEGLYPTYERPIYNCILDLFELKPLSARDRFLSEVYYAIHEDTNSDTASRVKKLESLFHQMKKYSLEQEAAPLLKVLCDLNNDNPLYAVYKHLHDKYANITQVNEECFIVLQRLNEKLSSYVNEDNKEISEKDLVAEYKTIRALHRSAENNTSGTILQLSMLLLATYCEQKQLLLEDKLTLEELYVQCKTGIQNLPFSVERYFLNNIYRQIAKYGIEQLKLKLNSQAVLFFADDANDQYSANFSFHIEEKAKVKEQPDALVNNFLQRFSVFSIPQDSFSIRPNQI